jgi:hypothetical protein
VAIKNHEDNFTAALCYKCTTDWQYFHLCLISNELCLYHFFLNPAKKFSPLTRHGLLQVICNDSAACNSPSSNGTATTNTSTSEPMDCNPTPPHSSPTHPAKSSLVAGEDIPMAETGSSTAGTGTSMQVEPIHPSSNCSSSTMIVECANDCRTSPLERLVSFTAWGMKMNHFNIK